MTNISQTLPASASQRPAAPLRVSSGLDLELRVKGKGSIRTLIRLANARAHQTGSEQDSQQEHHHK